MTVPDLTGAFDFALTSQIFVALFLTFVCGMFAPVVFANRTPIVLDKLFSSLGIIGGIILFSYITSHALITGKAQPIAVAVIWVVVFVVGMIPTGTLAYRERTGKNHR
ncbi:MAG: hypothetical protein Q7R54_00615 [bacterium]|nr:hypothetical protein [bacterium]